MMEDKYVLIVDDDRDVRQMFARLLESFGLNTQTASDGIEALSRIEDQIPDLILLDLMMPRMNGFDVFAYLRSHPNMRHIPVVVVTALSLGQGDMMLRLPGVAEVIEKPHLQVAELRARITALLGNGRD